MDFTKIFDVILNTENLQTLIILLAIILSPFLSKSVLKLQMKGIQKQLRRIADVLLIRVEKPTAYRMEMTEKMVNGSNLLKCNILKDVFLFKTQEIIKLIMTIHSTEWDKINEDYIVDLVSSSADKVNSHINKKMGVCKEAVQYYNEIHIKRTEIFVEELKFTITDDANDKGDRLHNIALLFIANTISLFNEMQIKCPHINDRIKLCEGAK